MTEQHSSSPAKPARKPWASWIFAAFMAITLFLLFIEHRAHALGWVLHLLVGACVLLLYLNTRAYEDDSAADDVNRR